jgi:predicted nucleotide-binding protein (sugar kinase/HSP70/actin superfamily)
MPGHRDERAALEAEIESRCAAARQRLENRARGTVGPVTHYRKPVERAFTEAECDRVTILFGGLTSRHDRLIQSVFQSCGYTCDPLPQPDLVSCQIGKQFCNNGVCNPAYFTIGTLIRYLQELEASGLSRREIVDRYVFFTCGSCGPCRFGMYESEYRLALRNAGFDGFRVLLFLQEQGARADTGEPGLKLTLHFGLGAANAVAFADALQAFGCEVRPYEATPGLTDRRLESAVERLGAALAARRPAVAADRTPAWLLPLADPRHVEVLLKVYDHLYGTPFRDALRACTEPLGDIEVDRLRVKPVVKITGEFWAQTTDGDGNFRMFEFLEREGAHVLVEPVGGWALYLLQYARARIPQRRGLEVPKHGSARRRLVARLTEDRRLATRWLLVEFVEWMYRHLYDRVRRPLAVPHALLDQRELARLADPYYRQLARGGEGHLEVGKSIYYTTHNAAHMVLSLKPFGCMPSTQSDGVQAAMLARLTDMLFLPIETGAEGELSAHSRVQMMLVEARQRAQAEFQRALESTGRDIDDIRRYVDEHPSLRRATYAVPHRPGVAGVAASFVLHVHDLMRRDRRIFRPRVAMPAVDGGAR